MLNDKLQKKDEKLNPDTKQKKDEMDDKDEIMDDNNGIMDEKDEINEKDEMEEKEEKDEMDEKDEKEKNKKGNKKNDKTLKKDEKNTTDIHNEDCCNECKTKKKINNNNKFQVSQMQINKQLIAQKISEEYTNDMLGRALSKAENFANRFGKQAIQSYFNYYNRFDNGFVKDKNSLRKSLINALDTLQDYYEMDGKKKKFPINFDQKSIINYISNLGNNCLPEDQEIFEDFITIIKGDEHIDFDYNFNKNCKVDPNVLCDNGIQTMKSAARQEKIWKQRVLEQGNYNCELQINKDWKNNAILNNIHQKETFL